MDQAEPENQILSRHLEKRRHDTNLGRHDLLFAALIHQIPNKMPTLTPRINTHHRRTVARQHSSY